MARRRPSVGRGPSRSKTIGFLPCFFISRGRHWHAGSGRPVARLAAARRRCGHHHASLAHALTAVVRLRALAQAPGLAQHHADGDCAAPGARGGGAAVRAGVGGQRLGRGRAARAAPPLLLREGALPRNQLWHGIWLQLALLPPLLGAVLSDARGGLGVAAQPRAAAGGGGGGTDGATRRDRRAAPRSRPLRRLPSARHARPIPLPRAVEARAEAGGSVSGESYGGGGGWRRWRHGALPSRGQWRCRQQRWRRRFGP